MRALALSHRLEDPAALGAAERHAQAAAADATLGRAPRRHADARSVAEQIQ
jgi:hypothetical protein